MLENGFIKLHRSMLGWEWYKDANTSRLFIHLLLTANYETQKWQGISILRGQRISSYQKLSEELNLSVKNIRTSLRHLITTGEVAHEPTSKYGLFTVLNYEKYQSMAYERADQVAYNTAVIGHTSGSQAAVNGQQRKKDNKYNNEKECNNKKGDKFNIIHFLEELQMSSHLMQSFIEFSDYRKSNKKPLTQLSVEKMINQLENWNYSEDEKIQCLNNSIMNGWQGIFPLNEKHSKKQTVSVNSSNSSYDLAELEKMIDGGTF